MPFKDYKLLETITHTVQKSIPYYHPESMDVISLETRALDVFSDFHIVKPYTIHVKALIDDALQKMQKVEVHSLLVVNNDDQIIGLINAKRLHGVYRTQVAQREGVHFKEMTSGMLMTKINALPVLEYDVLKDARVGHLARLMHDQQIDHLLIQEYDKHGNAVIRGIISASFIAKRLGASIGHDFGSRSLAELNKII
ncbi:CBS domain-containing protein [Fastidiosibacter lacustris]|uniref:CBS domain-containing protein n=1 Tax=Fastidiosibacter lacustris TaxID=2056695 RepID=UPI0013009EF5|nr:CBS domain-containing protein [Fastidiosibacter lacustris]